jgi:hypothetical protein
MVVVGFAGLDARDALVQQHPVLLRVEEAGLRIAVLLLPACDGDPCRIVKLSVDLGFEPELG